MKTRFTFAALIFSLAGALWAQTGIEEPNDVPKRDVFVILDVSGSMEDENKFPNVQAYLEKEVINGLLKTGDDFTLITFGDSAQTRFSRTIASDADKASLRAEVYRLEPDNNFTDIGMAMETLAEVLEKREESGVRRIILFVTDGLNMPPPWSKYLGVNLSLDERFRELGKKISQTGWFLYVIGIGGETDAQAIANAVPGAIYHTTDSNLSGVDVNAFVDELDAEEQAAAEAEEARRLEAERMAGILGFFRKLAGALGISLTALFACFLVLLFIIILLLIMIASIFKTREFVITDEQETLIKRLPPFAGITINSVAGVLPAIGDENNHIFRIQRSALGVKIKTLESGAIADNSPYKKGTRPLRGVITLANGRIIRITRR
ncbi:MAG: VWA domain-containing protein [Treponema sp.]|nr:VWA domain-containing protein [Treponema sp.]